MSACIVQLADMTTPISLIAVAAASGTLIRQSAGLIPNYRLPDHISITNWCSFLVLGKSTNLPFNKHGEHPAHCGRDKPGSRHLFITKICESCRLQGSWGMKCQKKKKKKRFHGLELQIVEYKRENPGLLFVKFQRLSPFGL